MTLTAEKFQEQIRAQQFDPLTNFKLNVDAYRIHLKHKFDPVSAVSIGKIDPLPHQIEAFVKMMAMLRPSSGIPGRIRMLLADDVGLGKTVMVGLVMKELLLRNKIQRVLVICPSGLQIQWHDELKEKFNEDFTVIKGSIEGNPYAENDRVIISVDTVRNEEKTNLLLSTKWNMVIFDEAHKLKPGNLRYGLAEKISTKTDHLILASATPHDGKVENFLGLVKLIDQEMENAHDNGELKQYLEPLMIRRLKEDIVNFRGKKIFPERSKPKTLQVEYSPEELEFYNGVEDYVRTYYQKAEIGGFSSVVLALYILHRRVSSSIQAGVISLRKRRLNLLRPYTEITEKSEADYICYLDEGDEQRREKAEEEIISATAALTEEELRIECEALDKLIEQGQALLDNAQDRKFQQLKLLVNTIRTEHPKDKIIIFTEFTDTLDFLEKELIKENFLVTKITGGLSPELKKQNSLIFEKRADILLGTEAAGEGLNLQFANIAINYELPWNPNRLEQRIGRIYRYGQKKEVYIYNFKTAFPIDEAVLQKILEKMENIRAIYGSNTIDVIGSMISEKEILEIFRISQGAGSAVDKVDQLFTEKLKVFDEIEQYFIKDSFNLVNVTSLSPDISRCIYNFDIERFFLTWAENNLEVDVQPSRDSQYLVHIPCKTIDSPVICADCGSGKYDDIFINGVFDPDKKGTYLSLGHPAVSCAIDDSLSKCACTIIQAPEKGIVLVYIIRFFDGHGREIYAEPVLLCENESQKTVLDPLKIWEVKGYGQDTSINIESEYYIKCLEDALIDPDFVLRDYINEMESFVRDKNEKDLAREYGFIYTEYNWKIRNQQFKKEEYRQKGLDYLIENVDKRISTLRQEIKELYKENQKAKNISWKLCGPVNIALLVTPQSQTSWNPETEQARINLEKLKKEIELKGMKIVCRYEKEHSRIPEDVSKETVRGYDILSQSKKEKRYIEVKSFSTTNPIQISSNEWRVASQLREDYYLYVVENISKDPNTFPVIIADPYFNLEKYVKKVPIEDYKMVLDKLPDIEYSKS
ncbi:helicase (Snf2/Rad54 family) [Methanosarcina mazei TMA]|uniref:Helicase (Snf2/Rad54 family) n=1 Tax=Methanosarcina mazei SarPi TaxID=1434115 RepID=A0A0E3R9L2_METMZ|nr:helicase (Snf2/Rad54 family) [Methanosarcina mazei SarPi]UWJ24000.1 helicase (Snf2/Rad54 family) [Methanosarcina mazei TMA]BBL64755.1 ATP-dependent RNA helicase [Methanosarcina mazei]